MIVRIPVSINYEEIYNATRRCWWANIDNARSVDYVIAVAGGIVQGVFKPEKWSVTTDKECEEEKERCKTMGITEKCIKKRIRFVGSEASADVKKRYLNKKIPSAYRGGPPVRYTF